MPLMYSVWIYLFFVVIDAQFLNQPDPSVTLCIGKQYPFQWSYNVTPNDAASVVWKKDSSTILTWVPSINDYTYGTGYSANKLAHNNNNGEITIKSVTSSDAGIYQCIVAYDVTGAIITSNDTTLVIASCSISQMSTSIATEGTTNVNSIFEFRNITIPMITGSIIPTNGISSSNSGYLNTGSTNLYAHTESTASETTNLDANIETTNSYASTETNEIQTEQSGITSIAMSTDQSVFVTTVAKYISGSFVTTNQIITETLAMAGYSIPSYIETLPSTFETSYVFPQTFFESSISFPKNTFLGDNSFYILQVSSDTLITTYSSKTSILSMAISPSYDGDSSIASLNDIFSVPIYTSDTTDSAFEISNVSRVNISLKTETILISLANATVDLSAINTVLNSKKSENEQLSISGNNSRIQKIITNTESPSMSFTSVIDQISYSSKINSHTVNATTGVYSKAIMTSVKSYTHISVRQSQTQLDIQDSTTNFQSTFLEPHSQSTDEVYSSQIPEYMLSTLQTTNLLLPFHTEANGTRVESYIETTNMMTFESQSGIVTMDGSLNMNPSSMQISAVLLDFQTTLLTTTINFNSKIIPSMIKPSSKQTKSGMSYYEIEASFKDSLFSLDSPSGSFTPYHQDVTNLSSRVVKSISTFSTNTIQSRLSEKNKTIIFITITAAVITMIVVILLIIFVKIYMSKNNTKPRREEDNLSWSNKSITRNTAFPNYSFTGKTIYPLLNTSAVPFEMFHYEQHWNDIE